METGGYYRKKPYIRLITWESLDSLMHGSVRGRENLFDFQQDYGIQTPFPSTQQLSGV